ncbi:hypothetical protein BCR44DRAFT_25890 [Catenaria anguillulae PL171]|uniref:Uncharacterized protein n=1 Tax=Catenaria anguillulae PL171 TaxID=765915 RepID=A0A1Y2HZU5_9FUNG|nr:hypothetical protein BCR44DRAFT_25890 [Catenaria anguillulae PL171]
MYLANPLMMSACWPYCNGIIQINGDKLSYVGATRVLEWGRRNGVRIQESAAMQAATQQGHLDVLGWWLQHVDEVKPVIPSATCVFKLCQGDAEKWAWWLESGSLKDLKSVFEISDSEFEEDDHGSQTSSEFGEETVDSDGDSETSRDLGGEETDESDWTVTTDTSS